MRIAMIGSRTTPEDVLRLVVSLSRRLVAAGHTITTGNAQGFDQAAAYGGNLSNPSRVLLYLPWPTYESDSICDENKVLKNPKKEWFSVAAEYHPAWEKLSPGAKNLMARNIGIVHKANACICYLNHSHDKPGGGGTGHGVRYCRDNGIPVYDLAEPNLLEVLRTVSA